MNMRAVSLSGPCEGKNLKLSTIPVPKSRPGWVLVRVRAFSA